MLVLASCAVDPATADRIGAARVGVQNRSSTSRSVMPSAITTIGMPPPPAVNSIAHVAYLAQVACDAPKEGARPRERHGEHSGHEAAAVVQGPLRPAHAAAGRGPATLAPATPRALTALTRATAPALPRLSPRARAPLSQRYSPLSEAPAKSFQNSNE